MAAARAPRPWATMIGMLVVVIFAAGVFGFLYLEFDVARASREALAPFTPTAQDRDPSRRIEGVAITEVPSSSHVAAGQRVAYDTAPPVGGPHDLVWANCTGTVYDTPVRNENMVHSLEHGAAWIAYDPGRISGPALQSLSKRVEGQDYLMLSPYPGLGSAISLQSWGHQLAVDIPADPRIDQFLRALRANQYTHPEPGAACSSPTGAFDPDKPPPFDPAPPGPDAVPLDVDAKRPGAVQPGPPAAGR